MYLKNYIFLGLIIFAFPIQATQTSATDDFQYPAFCAAAANDARIFAQFRRMPVYVGVLEHVSYEQGQACLKIIAQEYSHLMPLMKLFKTNDSIGNPNTCYYS